MPVHHHHHAMTHTAACVTCRAPFRPAGRSAFCAVVRPAWFTWRAHGAGWGLAAALLVPTAWAAPFTDNGDGTVTDQATGLMWDRCAWGQTGPDCAGGSATPSTWAQALAAAQTANGSRHKGHGDWRLPNKNELESLVKIDCTAEPCIDTAVFTHLPASHVARVFWSATTRAAPSSEAWFIDFAQAFPFVGSKGISYSVRLVRDGQPVAPYDAFTPLITTGLAVLPGANGTTAGAGVVANKHGTGHWQVLPAASAAPSPAALLASTRTVPLVRNVAASVALTGLTPGTAYTLHFIAISRVGKPQASVSSVPFATPNAPGAPSVTATPGQPGSGQVQLSWTVPADNGSPITGYSVGVPSGSCTPDPAAPNPATATSCTVAGLPNAASHSFTVAAINGVGAGPAGTASATLQGLQTITFANPGPRDVNAPFVLVASGGASGEPVTFDSSTPQVCTTTAAGQLSFARAGTCSVTARQAGTLLYAAAPPVPQSFAVTTTALAPVPGLSPWGLGALGLGLLALGGRRRRA